MRSEKGIENVIGNLLRAGVIASAVVTAIGGFVYLLMDHKAADYKIFVGAKAALRSVHGIMSGVFSFDGAAIIQLGVLILIITPVVRVIFSVFAFMKERDYTYVFITLLVLAVLLYSLSGGHI